MANPIGDTIELLSTTTPLTAGATWTSSAVVLGMYNSLVIMVKTDVDSTLFVDWSGNNGVDWDSTDSHAIVDTVAKRVVLTTQQKTMRIRLLNGTSNQTYLRLFTYGVVTNNSSLVSLISSVDIENLISGLSGKQTQVAQLVPITEYNFATGSTISTQCQNNSRFCPFDDLWSNASSVRPVCGIPLPTSSMNRYLFLRPGTTALDESIIQGRGHRLRGGETLTARFVGSFSVSDATGASSFIGMLPTPTNSARPILLPVLFGGAFGWYTSGAKTNNNFAIIYGDAQKVTRPNFNGDKCDGNGILPDIDFTDPTKPNMFQIEVTAGGNIRFSIMNPSDNKFVTVHQVTNLHNALLNPSPEMCFTMYSDVGTGYTTGTDEVRCISFTMMTDMIVPFPTAPTCNISWDVAVPGGTVNTIAIRNSTTYGSFYCQNPLTLANVSITTSGLNPVTVSFILDATVTGGTWTAPTSGYTFGIPVQNNITGTITYPSPANTIYQFELGANDKLYQEFNALTPFLYGYRPVAIQVTSKSTSDVRICLGLCA